MELYNTEQAIKRQKLRIERLHDDIHIIKKDYAQARVKEELAGGYDELYFRELAAHIAEAEQHLPREHDALKEFQRHAVRLKKMLKELDKEDYQKVFDVLAAKRYEVNAEIEATAAKLKKSAMQLKEIDEKQRDAVRKGGLDIAMQSPFWQVRTFLANTFHNTPIAYVHGRVTDPHVKGKSLNKLDTVANKGRDKKK